MKKDYYNVNGKSYKFAVLSFDKRIPNISAVYIFANKEYEPLYIGESSDIRERIEYHKNSDRTKWNCANEKGFNYICFHPVLVKMNQKENRRRIESELIDNYKPPCNLSQNR